MITAHANPAPTEAPILDVLAERWSTRVYDADAPLDESALQSALEAARWTPSANNTQPWRFIVARRGTPEFETVHTALRGFNQSWTAAASALVVFVAETETEDGKPLRMAAYDLGQAAAHFTVQAHASGLHTHQMGGFDGQAIADAFGLDSRFVPMTVMSVGSLGDINQVDEDVRERELAPRSRHSVSDLVLVGA
ncbi:Nitroreductase [Microbacterium sp. C448]|uniref:nitroreductase family protein n=1 Tax=unclassified Microbacterium TaxID=2609290 RepID=UPI0003DE5673|nr:MULTISPECIES: nitroreductase family protein [unclassified Microbacterium]MDO8381981.1 nitroreductase family protein [Microbacterium sp.]CDK01809.1 Nitroreductase [Microbacterium sp. C448]